MFWGRPIRSAIVATALFAGSITAALAQHPSCAAWQAELASLQGQRGGDAGAAQAARRAGAQLAQAVDQYRGLGCERGFSIFGDPPPPQCGRLRAAIGQLQEQVAVYQRQAEGGAVEDRRARLAAAIQNQCRAPQQRGFFETIFGIEPRRGEIDSSVPELDPEQQPQEAAPRGGSYTVCVRACDGFFFPLSNSPNGRGGQDEMCQALCPGADTTAYGMSNGGDIQNAVARSTGQPYSSLPNAGKFQRSFDAACSCKRRDQNWSQVLRDAEAMLDKRRGDVIVSEQRAAELSRPRTDPKAEAARAKAAAQAKTAQTIEPGSADDKPMPSENSPTSGTESAGVGPQTVEGERTLDRGDGLRRETQGVNGEKRTVRIVAPNLAPNLNAAPPRP